MNQKLKSILKFLLFLSIGIFLIWLSVHKLTDNDKQEISNALQRADYKWILLSILIGVLAHISRAIRWKMLMEPLGYRPKTSNTFFAIMVGYLANYAVPRIGEVSRCGILTRYEKVPFTESFGTVIVERLVDVLTFLVIVAIVFFIQFEKMYAFLQENVFSKLISTYIIAGGLVIFIFAFIIFRKKIMSMLGSKARNIITRFIEGIKAIRRVKSPALFIVHSLFIWLIYYITFHMAFFSMTETADISVGAVLTVFLATTLTIMLTPGGLGAFPLAVASVLAMYSINYSIGTAIGWLVWLSQFVSILFMGLLSLLLLPLLNKEQPEIIKT